MQLVIGMSKRIREEIAKANSQHSLSFLTGSGISRFGPSFLPSGYDLKKAFINTLVAHESNPAIQQTLTADSVMGLTLEQYFQEALNSRCDDVLEALGLLYVRSGQLVPVNTFHEILARWQCTYGGTVFTTNFDSLHERAYEQLAGSPACLIHPDHRRQVKATPYDAFSAVEARSIVKLHATARPGSLDFLRATVSKVGRTLESNVSELLSHFRDTTAMCVVGYSGSDPDVGPILLERSGKPLIWLLRPNGTVDPMSELGEYGRRAFGSCRGYAVVADMREFFTELATILNLPCDDSSIAHMVSDCDLRPWSSAWSVWSRARHPAQIREISLRILIAAVETEQATTLLSEASTMPSLDNQTKINQIWLSSYLAALRHRYPEAIGIARHLRTTIKRSGDKVALVACNRRIAHEHRMLGHSVRSALLYWRVGRQLRGIGPGERSRLLGISALDLQARLFQNQGSVLLIFARRIPNPIRGWLCRRSLRLLDQGLLLEADVGDLDLKANLLRRLGLAHALLRNRKKARECYDAALAIFRNLGRSRTGVVNVLGGLSDLYSSMGDTYSALEVTKQAISLGVGEGGAAGAAKNYGRLAKIAVKMKDADLLHEALLGLAAKVPHIDGRVNRVRFRLATFSILLRAHVTGIRIKK